MKDYILVMVISLFLLLGNNLNVYAQTGNLRFEYLTDELDIYGNSINTILQDSRGYIWLGSNDGLLKYDGYTFTRYQYNAFNDKSVSQNIISAILIDKLDTIWVGTPEGLCKFDPHTEKFFRYNASKNLMPDLPDNISAMNEDNEGNIWIGNWIGQLWRFNKKKEEFLRLDSLLEYQKLPGLPSAFRNYILSIYKDKGGTLWIGDNTALHRVNDGKGENGKDKNISFTHYQYNPSQISNNGVGHIFEDKNGILWFGSVVGPKSFNPKTGEFGGLLPKQGESQTPKFTGAISGIVEDHESNLWIATYDNGLHKLNRERTGIISWFQNENRGFGLKSNYISATMLDKGGNLFVSTDKGLHKVTLIAKGFGLLQHDSTDLNSLSDGEVMSLCEDRAGNLWIGTFKGGLNKWNKKSEKISHFFNKPSNPQSLKSNNVSAILNDRDGNLWICNGNNLSRLTNENGKFEHFNTTSDNSLSEDLKGIYSICQDKDGIIWLGTGYGIKSFNPGTHKFKHYYYEEGNPDGISDYDAASIFADSRGNIWIGTSSIAFNKLDKHTGRFRHYKNKAGDTSSISSNIVKCVFEDSKGNLWLGTSGGGLCQYNYNSDNFITHSEKKDVPWNTVLSIQEDEAGNLWLGTDNGLSCYITSNKRFINYDMKDGLQSNFFGGAGWRHIGSSCKGRDGTLYFGGINGMNYFDPSKIQPNNYIPPIVITQFKLFDKLLPGKNEAREIVLASDENFFSFEFAALNYTNSSKNKYAYQLEGVDHEWVYSGSRRYASYTNVAPGEYTFKVKGSNNDGIWNEKGIAIKVIVLPPWWRTWWAYGIYGLLLIAAIWATHRFQKQKVIRAEREKAQTKELAQAREIEKAYTELKATQAQLIQSEKMASLGELTAGIAHEIQNPLNFVNNFSEVNKELLTEMKDEIDKGNLDEVKSIANDVMDNQEKINHHGKRADAIVKGMLQHSRSSTAVKEPTDINKLADEYLRLAYHGQRAKDKSFNATLKTDFDESISSINVIPQDIGRAVLNLITNAFYVVGEKTRQAGNGYEPTVSVSTKKVENRVEIRVADNGNGIPPKVLDKIFQPFFTTKPTGQGTGLGLSLAYDIVKSHGGELKVVTNEGEGAVFIIQLPVV